MRLHTFMLSDIFCRVSSLCVKDTHTIVQRLESHISRCRASQSVVCAVDMDAHEGGFLLCFRLATLPPSSYRSSSSLEADVDSV